MLTQKNLLFSLQKSFFKIPLKYMKIAYLVQGPSFGKTLSIHMNIFKFLTLVFAASRRQNFGLIKKKSNENIISYFLLHEKDRR